MRITDAYGKLNDRAVESTGQGVTPAQPSKTGAATTQSVGAQGEKVTLSDEAQKLADSAEAEKVGKLQSSINDGTFQIDSQAIAKQLVDGG